MDPDVFKIMCKDAGADKLYSCIQEAILLDQTSEKRKNLKKMQTMVIIYTMLYSQSQKCNSFQVTLARTLQQFGISKQGFESLRNLGIVAHPKTVNISTNFHIQPTQVMSFHLLRMQLKITNSGFSASMIIITSHTTSA